MNDNRRNLALLLAAAVALVVGFLVLKPGSSDTTSTTATAPAATAPAATTPAATIPSATVTTAPAPRPEPVTVIRVKGGEPVGGIKDLSVKKGDTVRFEVVADAPEEVHTHGYDILKNVAPGTPARFAFEANLEGVFEIELEQSATQIGKLTVSP